MDSPFGQVFTVMTWNLFKKSGVSVVDWPGERREGMTRIIDSLLPDIICTQETAPEYLDAILGVSPHYKCIVPSDDAVVKQNCAILGEVRAEPFLPTNIRYRRGNTDKTVRNTNSSTGNNIGGTSSKTVGKTLASLVSVSQESGWLDEGNIVWRSDKFAYVAHGAVDIGLEAAEPRRPKRRLFWVRLRPRAHANTSGRQPDQSGGGQTTFDPTVGSSSSILVATTHLTWEGGAGNEHQPPYTNNRSMQAAAALAALQRLSPVGNEPLVFCGDMNDSWHVPFLIKSAGFQSADFLLNLPSEVTHPAHPFPHEERIPSQTRDWIFSQNLRPLLTRACANMTLGTHVHPSDHFPVMTVFELFV